MTLGNRRRYVALMVALVTTTAAWTAVAPAAAAGSTPSAAGKSNSAAGIGTKAALGNPDCDPDTGRVAIPYQWPPPCVKPFDEGDDNGGATGQGVTADSIKIVVRVASPPDQPAPQGVTNLASGAPASFEDAFRDTAAVWTKKLETWGREIEWDFFERSGTDEAAQRADALDAVSRKPFMVLDAIGDEIFCTDVASRKTICLGISGNSEIADRQKPYRYITGVDYWATPKYVAELIGKGLAGKKAHWAGDESLHDQTRKFGVVYTAGVNGIDIDLFNQELARWKAPKPAVALPYEPPLVSAEITGDIQEKAPTIITRLKSAGVNNVVVFAGYQVTTALTKAATANEFFPEWTITSFQVQELDLYARGFYDQEQWDHAYGVGFIRPAVLDTGGPEYLYVWYWGPNNGNYTTNSSHYSQLGILFRGIHLAGPKLTPQTFRDGFFSMPPTGGASQGQVINSMLAVGKAAGMPWTEYMIGGDFTLVWYSKDYEGLQNVGGQVGAGKHLYVDGAKRYRPGDLPNREPKFFDLETSVGEFQTRPPKDQFPDYPCDGCPSSTSGS
jgi:hypothetical protein